MNGQFKKGHKGYWLGKKSPQNKQIEFTCNICSKKYFKAPCKKGETKTCSSECRVKWVGILNQGNNNWMYKGDNVGYFALHNWVKRYKGKAKKCENCFTDEKRTYHWANLSGKYLRELEDWISLCVPCHSVYDRNRKSMEKIFDASYKRL